MSEFSSIEKLINRQEIADVIYRYARGGDRIDVELFNSTFWEDGGYADFTSAEPMHQMSESLLKGFMNDLFSITQHLNANILVDFVGTERAHVETYLMAYHLTRPDIGKEKLDAVIGPRRIQELGGHYDRSYEIVVGGRYLDNFERRGGQWRIKKRRLVFDWTTTNVATGLGHGEGLLSTAKVSLFGGRDRTDPSYQFDD